MSGRHKKPCGRRSRQSSAKHIAVRDTVRAQDTERCRPPREVGAGVRTLTTCPDVWALAFPLIKRTRMTFPNT
jgi:hypothetical protein